jgi:hypothetical protein
MPCRLRSHATKLKRGFVTSFTASYKACTDLPREQTTQEQPLSFQAVRQSQPGKKHLEALWLHHFLAWSMIHHDRILHSTWYSSIFMDIEIRILKRWDSFQKDIRGIPLRPYVRKSREGRLGRARGASCAFCQPTRSPSRIPDLSRSWRLRLWDVRRMFISHHFTSFISHHFTKVFNNWRPPLMACSACIACLSQSEQGFG